MKVLRFGIVCLLFVLSCPDGLLGGGTPKILLVNSNARLEKYEEAGNGFKKALLHPVVEVRLDEKKWTLSHLEDLIYDEDPELIYCIGTKAYLIASKYARKTDKIFSSIINWMRLPTTEKTFGVSNELHPGMQIMLFRHIFPHVKKIGVLYSREYNSQWFERSQEQAKDMGVEILGQAISGEENNIISSLKGLLPKVDALWLISDPLIMSNKTSLTEVLKECELSKTPVFSYHEAFVKYGVTLVLSVDNPTIGRQAAGIALEVLAGEKMEEEVQYPAGSHITLNLRKVKDYGLEYNADALASVNRIIE
jgi:putative ABC transport system substrate-binding protein